MPKKGLLVYKDLEVSITKNDLILNQKLKLRFIY